MCPCSLWIRSPSATSDLLFKRDGSRVNLSLHHQDSDFALCGCLNEVQDSLDQAKGELFSLEFPRFLLEDSLQRLNTLRENEVRRAEKSDCQAAAVKYKAHLEKIKGALVDSKAV